MDLSTQSPPPHNLSLPVGVDWIPAGLQISGCLFVKHFRTPSLIDIVRCTSNSDVIMASLFTNNLKLCRHQGYYDKPG